MLDHCVSVFSEFTNAYLSGDEKQDELYRLKIGHTMNVLSNASEILEREGVDGRTALLCQLGALFHDIGRFPQLKQYNTFRDRESTNHGRLGVLTLRSLSLSDRLSEEDLRIIRIAIGQHNLKTLNPRLPHPLSTPVHVVRDADKIDILRLIIEHFSKSEDKNPIITHGVTDDPGKYSSTIYDQIISGYPGDYKDIQYANDFMLIALGWTSTLGFKSSLKIIQERNLINQIAEILPKDNKIQNLINTLPT